MLALRHGPQHSSFVRRFFGSASCMPWPTNFAGLLFLTYPFYFDVALAAGMLGSVISRQTPCMDRVINCRHACVEIISSNVALELGRQVWGSTHHQIFFPQPCLGTFFITVWSEKLLARIMWLTSMFPVEQIIILVYSVKDYCLGLSSFRGCDICYTHGSIYTTSLYS